jgi:glutamine amidotransferase
MCRLFGFRSVIQSQVHASLLSAENALGVQSERHPDGWGVAYYVGGAPHLIKSASTALSDRLFHRVSGIVSSETVVAHIRRATQGALSPVNAHPFQFGRWIFAHNGNIARFEEHRETLRALIHPSQRRYILGETDSELLFHLLLSHLAREGDIHGRAMRLDDLASASRSVLDEVTEVVGPWNPNDDAPPTETFLSFVITDGRLLLAHQGGKKIWYSTWKHRCPEREVCPSWAASCEQAAHEGVVQHLLVSSEPLQGENVWTELRPGDMVGVDDRMRFRLWAGQGLGGASI